LTREVNDAGYALHGGRDGEDVAGSDRAVAIAVALKGVAIERLYRLGPHGGDRQIVELARRRHLQQALVHPAARRNVAHRVTDRDVVTQDGGVGRQIDERHLVALRHVLVQGQPRRKFGARR